MLRHRLPVGLALIAAFVLILWLDGLSQPYHFVWMLLVISAGVLASIELDHLLEKAFARSFSRLMPVCVGLCLGSNFISPIMGLDGLKSLAPLGLAATISVAGILLAGIRQFDGVTPVLGRVMASIFGVAYVGLLGSFLAQLRFFQGAEAGVFALALVVAITKGTDTGAYTFGKLFGRHLMTPILSPKKTWEGSLGGVLFALMFAGIVTWIEQSIRGVATLGDWWTGAFFAVSVSVAGQMGDLIESMIKRESRVKDASGVIPGFGGLLDLLDSLLLSAPVGWLILTIFC